MDNMRYLSIVAVLLSIVAVGVASLSGGEQTTKEVVTQESTGAATSNSLPTRDFEFGGVRRFAKHDETLTTASTTVCSLQGPAATSTLVSGQINFTTGSSTQLNVGFGKGDTKFATSTAINDANLSGGSQGTLVVGDSEGASFDEANVFGPDQWLVVQAFGGITAGDSGGGFQPQGTCQATWEVL